MNSNKEKLALIDIGNSCLKFFFNDLLSSFFYDDDWRREFKFILKNLAIVPNLALISSVNSNVKKEIINFLSDYHIDAIDSEIILKNQTLIDFSDISGMGDDRKLGLLAGLSFAEPPLITVDCGTAITINVLDKNFKCLGGVIFADIYTQAKGLSNNTADLDEVNLYFEKNNLGKNTEQALRIGIVKSAVWGIRGIIEQIIKTEFDNKEIPIFLSGGSANIIAEGLSDWKFAYEIKENLVLEGLITLITDNNI